MIQAAFQPQWWNSNAVVDANSNFLHTGSPLNTNEYSMMEYNFSMFWGVAIQLYEATLVSDNSRFDQFMEGNHSALTSLEQQGMGAFSGKGNCTRCHSGAELSDAVVSNIVAGQWNGFLVARGMILASTILEPDLPMTIWGLPLPILPVWLLSQWPSSQLPASLLGQKFQRAPL